MTYREVKLTLQDPSVHIEVSPYGAVSSTLHAHRTNNRGVVEMYEISLGGVGVWELACIARSSAKALRAKADCDIDSIEGRLNYAKEAWDV